MVAERLLVEIELRTKEVRATERVTVRWIKEEYSSET